MKDSEIDSYIILSIYKRVDIISVLNENKEKESQIIKLLKKRKNKRRLYEYFKRDFEL